MEFDRNRDFAKAQKVADDFLNEIKDWDAPSVRSLAIRRAGAVAVVLGNFPLAIELAHRARQQASRQGNNGEFVTSLLNEARLQIVMGDAGTAEKLLAEAAPLAGNMNDDTPQKLALLRVDLAILKRQWAEARAWLHAAASPTPQAMQTKLQLDYTGLQVARGENRPPLDQSKIREVVKAGTQMTVPVALCEATRAMAPSPPSAEAQTLAESASKQPLSGSTRLEDLAYCGLVWRSLSRRSRELTRWPVIWLAVSTPPGLPAHGRLTCNIRIWRPYSAAGSLLTSFHDQLPNREKEQTHDSTQIAYPLCVRRHIGSSARPVDSGRHDHARR